MSGEDEALEAVALLVSFHGPKSQDSSTQNPSTLQRTRHVGVYTHDVIRRTTGFSGLFVSSTQQAGLPPRVKASVRFNKPGLRNMFYALPEEYG